MPHWIKDKSIAAGNDYIEFLSQYMGGLALCSGGPVPKYFEMPMAGCVTFAEYHKDYEDLGFKDNETCIYVTKTNFEKRIKQFLFCTSEYQEIADAGRKLMLENYTAKHFAEFIWQRCKEVKHGTT